ncbi:hypothetical protein GCM10009504_16000 [Pseudomonas laurentiana]|nr:hypothetical protein GCM10009504_16000 [Pseudomonas laurentiana]
MHPPQAPNGASVDSNMETANLQKLYFKNGGSAFLLSWFYSKVRNHGEWDYKQHGRKYEAFGNFNYGACGIAAGISESVLLRGAGWAQSRAGTSNALFGNWWEDSPYGDDPRDQEWIKAGIEYAQYSGY